VNIVLKLYETLIALLTIKQLITTKSTFYLIKPNYYTYIIDPLYKLARL